MLTVLDWENNDDARHHKLLLLFQMNCTLLGVELAGISKTESVSRFSVLDKLNSIFLGENNIGDKWECLGASAD